MRIFQWSGSRNWSSGVGATHLSSAQKGRSFNPSWLCLESLPRNCYDRCYWGWRPAAVFLTDSNVHVCNATCSISPRTCDVFWSFLQVFGSWSHSSLTRFQCSAMFFFCRSWSSSCSVSLACSYGKESWEIDALPPSLKIQPSLLGKAHFRSNIQLWFVQHCAGLVIRRSLVQVLHPATGWLWSW